MQLLRTSTADHHRMNSDISTDEPLTARFPTRPRGGMDAIPVNVFKLPVWWLGLVLVLAGEVGNFAA